MRISQENFTVKGLLSLSSLLQYTQAGTKAERPDTGVQGGEGARLSGSANDSQYQALMTIKCRCKCESFSFVDANDS